MAEPKQEAGGFMDAWRKAAEGFTNGRASGGSSKRNAVDYMNEATDRWKKVAKKRSSKSRSKGR
jgi:hypothetical protein